MDRQRPDLGSLFFAEKKKSLPNTYTKRTILNSPIIKAIYPGFRVSLSKPISGLTSTSINDEDEQTLHAPEQDSYFGDDMSEDDDIVWNLDGNTQQVDSKIEPVYSSVSVMVKLTSMTVDGVEFALNTGVRSCAVVSGVAGGEDSLLLSIQSGFILLVRIWRVPRAFGDASSTHTDTIPLETTTSHYYKPFVVQWWKTATDNTSDMSGTQISAHASGMAVVAASASSLFRIHMCKNTDAGMQLLPHYNVPVNGVILHSCFSQPPPGVGDNHLMFLTVTFSNQRRLNLNLYSWYVSDSLTDNLTKSTLPLNNSFPVPVMVVPLAANNAFLFISSDMFVVVTVHNITSADYSFSRYAYDGNFPTAFYLPESYENDDEDSEKIDYLYLASDSGTIYSVLVTNTSLSYDPVIQVADPISVFTLEKLDTRYTLNYASDTGAAKELLLPGIFPKGMLVGRKLPYSEATLVRDYRNWAPVVDVLVMDTYRVRNIAPYCSQEVWALTGVGKRMKLSQLRSGYMVRKETKSVAELRKTNALFPFLLYDRHFVVCSMSWDTKLLEYDASKEDSFVEIESPTILSDETTLLVAVVPDSTTIVQFTPTRIAFSNLEEVRVLNLENQNVLHVKMVGNVAALLIEYEEHVFLKVFEVSPNISYTEEETMDIREICCAELDLEPSALALHVDSDKAIVFLGGFDGSISVLNCTDDGISEIQMIELEKINPYPSDNVVPCDIVYLSHTSMVFVGSDSGHVVQMQLQLKLELVQFLKLGYTSALLHLCKTDPHLLLVGLRNLWLFNFYASKNPMQVAFDEKSERPVSRIAEIPSITDQHLRYIFTREDGLVIGSLFCHKMPLLRQISIGDSAKRICFLDSVNLFAILCKSREPLARLRFVDRKTNRMLPTVEVDYKTGKQRTDCIFSGGEVPTCGFVWRIQRQDRVSKKLLVGTSLNSNSGSIKILDVSKISVDDSPSVKVVELVSILGDAPVTCIEQIESTIFFSSGCKIYSTSYSFDDKKLRPVQTLTTLSSNVVSMSVDDDDHLLVNTRLDSLIVFKYHEDIDLEEAGESLSVSYKDPVSRSLVNHASIGKKIVAGDKLHSSLVVVDSSKSSVHPFNYRLSMIPRVFIAGFNAIWSSGNRDRILCVGVNGEVVGLDPIYDQDPEITALETEMELKYGITSTSSTTKLDWLADRLNRPFADKVTGKGFQNIYKPYFDFTENRDILIDYDLEDLAAAHTSSMMI